MTMSETNNVYPITNPLGTCVIFNIESYVDDKQDRRDGTEFDNSKIESTFRSFGYNVHSVHNPTKNDIKKTMKTILGKKQSVSSSFICFILTHGTSSNQIVTHDNVLLQLNDIVQMSDVPALYGKPKIFVVQTCRGGNSDDGMYSERKGVESKTITEFDEMMLYPRKPDFLLIFATPPGYLSYRSSNGSDFIQMLCQTLEEDRDKATVCVLLQRLSAAVSYVSFPVENETGLFLQVPYFMSTLRRSLMLHHSASSGDMQFMTKHTELNRQHDVRVFHIRSSDDERSVQRSFLTNSHGCYDLSSTKLRHCLVINHTTERNFLKAEQDHNSIEKTMKSLTFTVKICNNRTWENELRKSLELAGEIGCLFCFIQIDADDDIFDSAFVAKILTSLKNERRLLNKPKVYIIQPYNTNITSEPDFDGVDMSLKHPVRNSKESDVLMVQILPVRAGKTSFIELFCSEYLKHAGEVPMMGFLERILPGTFVNDWLCLQPTLCSTMRKHLVIHVDNEHAPFKSDMTHVEHWISEEDASFSDRTRVTKRTQPDTFRCLDEKETPRLRNVFKTGTKCSVS